MTNQLTPTESPFGKTQPPTKPRLAEQQKQTEHNRVRAADSNYTNNNPIKSFWYRFWPEIKICSGTPCADTSKNPAEPL